MLDQHLKNAHWKCDRPTCWHLIQSVLVNIKSLFFPFSSDVSQADNLSLSSYIKRQYGKILRQRSLIKIQKYKFIHRAYVTALYFSGGKVIYDGEILKFNFYGRPCKVIVCGIRNFSEQSGEVIQSVTTSLKDLQLSNDNPSRSFYKIDKDTNVVVVTDRDDHKVNCTQKTLGDVGGLDRQISAIQEIVSLHLKSSKQQQAGT